MSFADLNKYVLPFNFPQNEYEEAINVHCKEDANHWPWYLHDLKTPSSTINKNLPTPLDLFGVMTCHLAVNYLTN